MVRSIQEKWGTDRMNCNEQEFAVCEDQLDIEDLAFSGFLYTWDNNRVEEAFVPKKLDRVMANIERMSLYGQTAVEFMEGGVCDDHSPAIIAVGKVQISVLSPLNFLISRLSIKISWLGLLRAGGIQLNVNLMFRFCARLKSVKKVLQNVSKEIFRGIAQKVLQSSVRVDEVDQIKNVAEDFYRRLLGETHHVFRHTLPAACIAGMGANVSEKEIRDVIFSMNGSKAPGPDGFSAAFYHKSWPVVGGDLIEAVKDFFENGKLLKAVNASYYNHPCSQKTKPFGYG